MQIHTIDLGIPTNWHPLFWPLTWKTPPIFQQPPAVEAWLSELSLNLNTCDVSNFHRGIDGTTARFLSKAVVYKWYYHKWINYRGHSITNPNNALLIIKKSPPKKYPIYSHFWDPPNMGHSLTPELLREVGTLHLPPGISTSPSFSVSLGAPDPCSLKFAVKSINLNADW